jgi:nitrile hydratase
MKNDSLSRFAVGDVVRVDDREVVGHCRTPWFLRGKTGVVVERLGVFRDPERLAYHRPGYPAQTLYAVRFQQSDLWPAYAGAVHDHLDADLYESWLSPAEPSRP